MTGCDLCESDTTVSHYQLCESCYDREYQKWVNANGGHIPKGNRNGEI